MMRTTPRQELEKLDKANEGQGFYGTPNQFAELIRHRLDEKAREIMGSIFNGFLPVSERLEHMKIYDMLLDGKSMKTIKDSYK